VDVADGWFDYGSYTRFLAENAASVEAFRARQSAAFAAEKERWRAAGEFDRAEPEPDASAGGAADPAAARVPAGATGVTAPFIASVWQVDARPGMRVAKGDKLAALEAMKMETIIAAPHDGTVAEVYAAVGTQVVAGQVLLALVPDRPGQVSAR
jgi:urea carboxylase